MQTLLPLTLSLTFCNHEILMTVIEFKAQFVSESFSGKGSCKGTVFKEMAGWRGRLGKPVLEWPVLGGCIRPPLPGPKLEGWSLATPDSKELSRLARASPSGSPQAKSRFYSPLVFSLCRKAHFMIYICICVHALFISLPQETAPSMRAGSHVYL